MSISKIEFISSTEIAVASPTVLATYTNLYNTKFSAKENSSPVGYFIQSPRTLEFELDVDTFLTDEVYDSSNDMETGTSAPDKLEMKFKFFSNKCIKVYKDDVFTFSGILLPDDMSYSEDKSKFSFKFSNPMLMITNIQDNIPSIMTSSISNALDNMKLEITDQFLGSGSYSDIPLVQDYTEKGSIEWVNNEIDDLIQQHHADVNFHGHFLTDQVNYVDVVVVMKELIEEADPLDNHTDYKYYIYTFVKSDRTNSLGSEWFGGIGLDGLALMTASLTTLGYSGYTYTTGDSTITLDNDEIYNTYPYGDPYKEGSIIVKFTGYDFIESLDYQDNTNVKYSQFLDIVTIINNLQIQTVIEDNIPKFYITNKDVANNTIVINENDMLEIKGERLQIENADYEVFDILDETFKNDIVPDIQEYYRQFGIMTNRKISFILSNITTDYGLSLDDKFEWNSTDWKVARISNKSEKIQEVEAWIISKGIEILYPNGGQLFIAGNTYDIQWRSISINNTETVAIELWKGGIKDSDIITSTVNDGSFHFDTTGLSGTDYKIKIKLISDIDVNDMSDSDFTVVDPDFIFLNSNEFLLLNGSNLTLFGV